MASPYPDQRLLPGGAFLMGSADFYPDERPVRAVTVAPFAIDTTPVTNAQFARFVVATGHITQAERPTQAGDPPASLVFMPTTTPVDLTGPPLWWQLIPGADWQHPTGPDSDIATRADHPVVHIALADAQAYADWAGKALPSEVQWEYAARGGLDGANYAWGHDFTPGGHMMAKTWAGAFPWYNAAPAGLERTSPVGSYPANGHGLFDMIGNVWEWTTSAYQGTRSTTTPACCGPATTATAFLVTKGGSHLCAPDYCQRYRPAARWPQPADATTSHLGFRCVSRA